MNPKDNMVFQIWKGGVYKEALFLLGYRFGGIFVAHIVVLLLWMFIAMEEYAALGWLLIALIIYAFIGAMLVSRSRGQLIYYKDRMVLLIGSKSVEMKPEDIKKVQAYSGKSANTVPYTTSYGKVISANYDVNYTVNVQIRKKWYSLYNVYKDVEQEDIPDKIELHQVYLQLKQYSSGTPSHTSLHSPSSSDGISCDHQKQEI